MNTEMIDILFVDDSESMAEDMPPLFATYGFRVHPLTSAQDVAKIGDILGQAVCNIRAIVLDLMMPPPEGVDPEVVENGYMTGLFLYKKYIKPLMPHVPVVILTSRGYGFKEIEKEPEIVKVVSKPIYPEELAELLRAIVGHHHITDFI